MANIKQIDTDTSDLDDIKEINADGADIIEKSKVFLSYYSDNVAMLIDQQSKLEKLASTLEAKITNMMKVSDKATLATAQLMESLVSLRTLQVNCNNSLFNIRKAILDYTLKTKPKNAGNDNLAETVKALRTLSKITNTDEKKQLEMDDLTDEEMNELIDKQLNLG